MVITVACAAEGGLRWVEQVAEAVVSAAEDLLASVVAVLQVVVLEVPEEVAVHSAEQGIHIVQETLAVLEQALYFVSAITTGHIWDLVDQK